MNILITGAKGFVGKNLVAELHNHKEHTIFEYDVETDPTLLDEYCRKAEFVYHLAGVNRPQSETEFMQVNYGLTEKLLSTLMKYDNTCPIMISSSIQSLLDNPYGRSKKAGEDLLLAYGREIGAKVLVYRLPNLFGKWSKPNYNSAVATFCHNIARDLPITINDRDTVMNLVYIDDLLEELLKALKGLEEREGDYCIVPTTHTVKLGHIADLIHSFKESRVSKQIPDMQDPFAKALYSTYLSFLPKDMFGYELKMNTDHRGSFTEFLKTPDRGQVSINISKPGITKGNHWHHTKNEKFLVVSGTGVIRFRNIIGSEQNNTAETIEYHVSGDKLTVIDIPTGYTHNIENLGDTDMVTVMWANEPFDPEKPDTYYLEV